MGNIYNPPTPASIGAVPTSRLVSAGTNMTGGGALSTDITLNGPGASAMTQIAETVTSGSAASVSFTGIAATYRDLIVIVSGRSAKAAVANDDLRMRVNNDSSAIYDSESTQGSGATSVSFGNLAMTSAYVGNLPAATAPANAANSVMIELFNYRRTTFQKDFGYKSGLKAGTAVVANLFQETGFNYWRSTAAINRVDVFCGTGPFVDGTVVTLYGRT